MITCFPFHPKAFSNLAPSSFHRNGHFVPPCHRPRSCFLEKSANPDKSEKASKPKPIRKKKDPCDSPGNGNGLISASLSGSRREGRGGGRSLNLIGALPVPVLFNERHGWGSYVGELIKRCNLGLTEKGCGLRATRVQINFFMSLWRLCPDPMFEPPVDHDLSAVRRPILVVKSGIWGFLIG